MGCQATPAGIGSIAQCESGVAFGGCNAEQPQRQWLRSWQGAASAVAANGMTVQPDIRGTPASVNGRQAIVVGIFLDAFATIVIDATINTLLQYYQASSAFKNLFLQDVSGWQYLAGSLDGRTILVDRFARNGNYSQGEVKPVDNVVAANHGTAETVTIPLGLYIPLSRLGYAGYGIEGAIPLTALQAKGLGAIMFDVGAPVGTMPTHLAWGAFTGTITVWLEVIYVGAALVPLRWQLESYTQADIGGVLRHGDRKHEYVFLRYLPEDTGGQSLADFTQFSLNVNGQAINPSLSLYDMEVKHALAYGHDQLYADPNALFPAASNTRVPGDWSVFVYGLSLLPYQTTNLEAAAGVVQYQFQKTGATHTSFRFLHRTTACQDKQSAAAILTAAFGCGGVPQPTTVVATGVTAARPAGFRHPQRVASAA